MPESLRNRPSTTGSFPEVVLAADLGITNVAERVPETCYFLLLNRPSSTGSFPEVLLDADLGTTGLLQVMPEPRTV